jgi:hypothetical protein
MYFDIVLQMKKQLAQLDKWLDAATEYAKTKSFDPNTLLTARLAPDQFAFARQVQSACDNVKFAAARVAGKDPPKNEDNEKTIGELKTRVAAMIDYLGTFTEKDFQGAADRKISLPRWEGKSMTAHDYLLEHSLPNFYFHVTTAYAILRHNGVPLGKRDYLGTLTQK